MNPDSENSRRDFAKTALLAGIALPVAAEAADQPDDWDEAGAIVEIIKRRFPNENLTDEVCQKIRHSVTADLARARRLKEFPLEPSDQPALIFQAYRAEDEDDG